MVRAPAAAPPPAGSGPLQFPAMSSPRLRRLAVAPAVLALLVAACGGGDDDAAPTTTAQPRRTTTTAPPDQFPANAAPLTGVVQEDTSKLSRPALVVKVENANKARPPVGLHAADVVVEEQVEGGVTRFAVLYHSADADTVGPVRSARSTDILFMRPLNRPLFAYSGANALFQQQVREAPLADVGINNFPGDYRRDRGRAAPANLFTSTPALFAHAPAESKAPPPLFDYRFDGSPVKQAGQSPAVHLDLFFQVLVLTDVDYDFDPATSTWKRTQNGTSHVDADGRQLAPVNVVVQFVTYRDTGLVDQSGAGVPEANLVGEGEAWVLTQGQVVKGRWSRPTPDSLTTYTDADGKPIKLTPGQTWLELVPPGQASVR